MVPFRRSQSRRWGGAPRLLYRRGQIDVGAAPRWFHGIDGDTIILKRLAGPAPIKFPNPHIGARIFEVPNRHRYCDHKIVMSSSGAPCLAGAGVGRHGTDILQLPAEL